MSAARRSKQGRTRLTVDVWRRPVVLSSVLALVVALPVVLSIVHAARGGWWPVDDHALTGLSAYDVLHGRPPVMGPRTTTATVNGIETHHPGPLLYYLLAVPLQVFGGEPLGLLVGSAIITLGLAWLACWAAARAFGMVPAGAVAAAFLALQVGLGPGAPVLPFNPYPPAFATVTCGVLVWGIARGFDEFLPHAALVLSLMIQSHVSYLAFLTPGLVVLLLAAFFVLGRRVYRRWGQRRRGPRVRRRRGRSRRWWSGVRERVRDLKWVSVRERLRRTARGRRPRRWRPVRSARRLVRWVRTTPMASAAIVLVLVWLPPAIELVRFHPHNNLQQVLRYVTTGGGDALPFVDVLLTGIATLAPIPGGLVTAQVWEGPSVIASEPRSVEAVVVGALMLVCLVAAALVPPRARVWLRRSGGGQVLVPSADERALARVVLILVLGCVTLGSTIPEGSAAFTWNYLQLWSVGVLVWLALGLFVLRRVVRLLPRRRSTLPAVAITLALVASLPALLADRSALDAEGAGVRAVIHDVRGALNRSAEELATDWSKPSATGRHVVIDAHTLGSVYGVAPSIAFGIKGDRPFHLPAVWTLPEDTEFRKARTAPENSLRVVIRDGRPEEVEKNWPGRIRLTRAVRWDDESWFSVFVVEPPPEADG